MPKDFKEYCNSKNMSVLRLMLEDGPSKDDLSNWQINTQEFYEIVEDSLNTKYRN